MAGCVKRFADGSSPSRTVIVGEDRHDYHDPLESLSIGIMVIINSSRIMIFVDDHHDHHDPLNR